ncbi:MAG: LMBR1 domain-containing protein [bacterium]|nr:LMBR1 domain-containing protein [bacterium]
MNGQEKQGMFRKSVQAEPSASPDQLNELNRRTRLLEEKHSNLEKRLQVSEQGIIRTSKELKKDIKATNLEIHELKKEIADLKDELKKIISELIGCARKDEVDVLRKYVNLWAPVNFVTQDEVERMVKELISLHSEKTEPAKKQKV